MTESSIFKKIKVKNAFGLHTRPATMIVQCLQKSKSEVWITHNKERVDARSILNLLMLAVQKNGEISLEVKGVDAQETMTELVTLFQEEFGEKESSSG